MAKLKVIHSRVLLVEEIFETVMEVEDDFDVDSSNLHFMLEPDDWAQPKEVDVLDTTEENILEWEWL